MRRDIKDVPNATRREGLGRGARASRKIGVERLLRDEDMGKSSKVEREDVSVYYVPATRLAGENGTPTLANMILMGKLLQVFDEYDEEHVNTALGKCISARHADLLGMNLKCMEIGRDYQE